MSKLTEEMNKKKREEDFMLHVLQENPDASGPFLFSLFYLVGLAFPELLKRCVSKDEESKRMGMVSR